MIVNFVSVWTGPKYDPIYVPILHNQFNRNCSTIEQRHYCLTDRPDELPEGITPIALPPGVDLPGWWAKIALFSPDMPWSTGDRITFMDLDSLVVGRLEDLVQRKGMALDWHTGTLGSAVLVWDHGEHSRIWTEYAKLDDTAQADLRDHWGGDQDWMDHISREEWPLFPKGWILSYRSHATSWPPGGSKVVCCHGRPKPHECVGWVENVWKINGFTSLPEMTGVNVTYDTLYDNVRENLKRALPWFTGYMPTDRGCVLVCGGPSMKDELPAIRAHKRRGTPIVTVNNALRFLIENGIKPSSHIMLDARPDNVSFVQNVVPGVRYFLASQCHPSVFDALSEAEVVMWHNAIGEGEEMEKLAKPYEDAQRHLIQVPGGCTVGLRAMYLVFLSGFKKLHIYGMDSSYQEGKHHAYDQPINDGDNTLEVVMGDKHYLCARWMARQAEEFRGQYHDLIARGMNVFVHGTGLIPDMARAMRKEAA